MYKLIATVSLLLIISCFNSPTDSQSDKSDKQAIETISGVLTDQQIDSIVINHNAYAIVYYKSDTINFNVSTYSYLWVYNVNSSDTSNSIFHIKPVRVENWISDSNCLTRYMKINLNSDSIHFSVIAYDTIPIDTLRTILQYMSDSTLCDVTGCYRVPLDSMTSIAWEHKNDTIMIGMSQKLDNYSGIGWSFKVFGGIVKLWYRLIWME